MAGLAAGVGGHAAVVDGASAPQLGLMPMPAAWSVTTGRMAITGQFSVAAPAHTDARLRAGIERFLRRWEERMGFELTRDAAAGASPAFTVTCDGPGPAVAALGEDESYALDVTAAQIALRAPTVVGALRGLETLGQLLASDAGGWHVPAVTIRDQPRFQWRGLLIDISRHWISADAIKRQIDGMAAVKLNVLHLHLTDDQGFRIESRKYPRLHECGSDGLYLTQDQVRDLIAYAYERGIRVVPEIDVPGHTTSWLVGHPELASQPGPYAIARRWGVQDPALDPTNEAVYAMLDGFLGEIAALFPDAYLHIGGDEVNGKHWSASPRIQAFIREHGLKDNAGMQAHFNRRLQTIVSKHGKKMIGWDEILHPDLPSGTIIHTWRGAEALAKAARAGFQVILSHGFYIDHMDSVARHYANEPLPANTALTPEEQRRVLGGEATMWGEWITEETIDSRIWPRSAAVAERLWSPGAIRDRDDMFRRMEIVSLRLEETGLRHRANADAMLRRFVGEAASPAALASLRVMLQAVEPVKNFQRHYQRTAVATQRLPYTGLVDCVSPDSPPARKFADAMARWIFVPGERDAAAVAPLVRQLAGWRAAAEQVRDTLAPVSLRTREAGPTIQAMIELCAYGEKLIALAGQTERRDEAWLKEQLALLSRLAHPPGQWVELMPAASLRLLVCALATDAQRAGMPAEAWRKQVEKLAATKPPKKTAP